MNRIAFFIIFILLLTGCQGEQKTDPVIAQPQAEVVQVSEYDFVDIYIENKDYTLAKLEPENGCMLGMRFDDRYDFDNVNDIFLDKNNIYGYEMYINSDFPITDVLECYVNNCIPLITVKPPLNGNGFDLNKAESLALDFGRLNIPLMVEFYPDPCGHGFLSEDYISFYSNVREIFREKAPNCIFVWSTNINNVQQSISYYPGDKFVDWVGMSLYVTTNDFENDIYGDFDYFYYTFQSKKPIVITSFGVSHFSTENHKYFIEESSQYIKNFYDNLRNKYPSVKAVVYDNRDFTLNSPKNAVRQTYSIIDDNKLLDTYKNATDYMFFDINSNYKNINVIKSPFKNYYKDGILYISNSDFEYFIKKAINDTKVLINDQFYVQIEDKSSYEKFLNGFLYKG